MNFNPQRRFFGKIESLQVSITHVAVNVFSLKILQKMYVMKCLKDYFSLLNLILTLDWNTKRNFPWKSILFAAFFKGRGQNLA